MRNKACTLADSEPEIAGNIIPAIATTNAMIGGFAVLAAYRVLKSDVSKDKLHLVFLQPHHVLRPFVAETPYEPNPYCGVCTSAYAMLRVDLRRATLQNLVDLLKKELSYSDEIAVSRDGGGLLYDVEEDVNLPKKLDEIGVGEAAFVTITDEADEPRVDLMLSIVAEEIPEDQPSVRLDKKPNIALKPRRLEERATTNGAATNGLPGAANGAIPVRKRKREADEVGVEDEQVRKKGKAPEQSNDADPVVVVDDAGPGGDGSIWIDDD